MRHKAVHIIRAVGRYNAFVMGMHNYYQMATHVACDVNSIDYQVFRTFELRTHTSVKRSSATVKAER